MYKFDIKVISEHQGHWEVSGTLVGIKVIGGHQGHWWNTFNLSVSVHYNPNQPS